jgi:hypothetical protein
VLPTTWQEAVREEWRRAWRTPYETPIVVAVNGLLVIGAWFLLPTAATDWLFVIHGVNWFPVALASWMFSDVPATNVMAPDRERTAPALADPPMLRRLLYAKNAVLWFFVAPVCTVVAVILAAHDSSARDAIGSIVMIAVLPLGALGISAWVGMWWPYHPRPLRWRWEHRGAFRRVIVRWLTLAVAPYGVVPALSVLMALPALGFLALKGHDIRDSISDSELAAAVLISAIFAIGSWWGGHRIGLRIACRRRRDQLRAYLGDPELG